MIAKEENNFFIFLLLTCHRLRDGTRKGSGEWRVGRESTPCSHSPFPTAHSLLLLCPFRFSSSRYFKRASGLTLSLHSHFTAVPIRLHLMPVSLWKRSGALGSKERCT